MLISGNWPTSCMQKDTVYLGDWSDDIYTEKPANLTNADHCASWCDTTMLCYYFSWDGNRNKCWLTKNSEGVREYQFENSNLVAGNIIKCRLGMI